MKIKRRWFKILSRRAQLFRALLVAAWFSLRSHRQSWPRVKAAVLLWLDWGKTPNRPNFWQYYRRNKACRKCAIFYKPLGTCGSPLDKNLESLGCWCHCATKSEYRESTCWLDAATNGRHNAGWNAAEWNRSAAPTTVIRTESIPDRKCNCGGKAQGK